MAFSARRFSQCKAELSRAVQTLSDEVRDREVRTRYGVRYYTLEPDMSITGLQSGAFKSLLADMKREIAAAQSQGIADVRAAKDTAAAEIKSTIASVKDKIHSEVSDALQEFAEFTNGGPPLDVEPPVIATQTATPLPQVNIVPDALHIDTGTVERFKLQNGESA